MKYLVDDVDIAAYHKNLLATFEHYGSGYNYDTLATFHKLKSEPYEDWRDKWEPKDIDCREIIDVDASLRYYVYLTTNKLIDIVTRKDVVKRYLIPLQKNKPQPIIRWAVMNSGQLDTWLFESESQAQASVDKLNKNGGDAVVIKFEGHYKK